MPAHGGLVFVLTCALAMAVPLTAQALTASAPANVLGAATVGVTLADAEPTGTVSLLVDGRVVSSKSAVPGAAVRFSSIPLTTGWHTVQGSLTSSETTAPALLSAVLKVRSWQRPALPTGVTPATGSLTARSVHISARAGAQTTSLLLYVNDRLVSTRAATPGSTVRWSYVGVPWSRTTFRVVAGNPVAVRSIPKRTLRQLSYPRWTTCIIIDKSDYRLYWIRNNVLVKAYPIAHGKHNCTPVAIWRIDAKYQTGPASVYGPRKMRLFRQGASGSYRFSAYGIHGTNQPWVIGTQASHGCIRMYNKDVLVLWPQVPLHTMVQTRQ